MRYNYFRLSFNIKEHIGLRLMDLKPPPLTVPATPSYPPQTAHPMKPAPSPAYYLPIPAAPSYSVPSPSAVPTYPGVPASSPPLPTPAASPVSYPPVPAPPEPYPSPPDHKGIKGAYWPSFDGFEASSIDTSYFTHIFYAFLLPDPVTFKLNVTPFDQQKIPGFIQNLRTRNPPVKTLLSMGGGSDAIALIFANLSGAQETRKVFIDSTIEVARTYGFDGLDLDWEYPANDQEMINLALLVKEWHEALVHEASASGKPRLLLTAAVYYSSQFTTFGLPRSYPADSINKYVDWINPMCYDYHGTWENFTGPNAALYDPKSNVSTSFGIGSWIQAGVSPKKLVMGLPLYGRTWKLLDPNVNGIGARAVGKGPGGGILDYYQVLEFNKDNNAIVNFDGQTVSYYSYAGGFWVGYDDSITIDWKVQFARSRGLGGYFFWALGQDKDWIISKQGKDA
jgi:chitinase